MAYRIEFGLQPSSYFYAEFLIRDRNSGLPMPLAGVKHLMVGRRHHGMDYGWGCSLISPVSSPSSGCVLASDDTGEVQYPAPGVLALAIPAKRFWWGGVRHSSLGFELYAIPDNPDFTSILATGTLSFGDRAMPARITLDVYPLYPNALVAYLTPTQFLRALATTVTNSIATLQEAIPTNPDDPNRVILDTSRDARPGGAFETLIAITLALTTDQLATVRALAATLPA